MQPSHKVRPVFDDPNLVSSAGLVPALRLAESAGLYELLAGVTVPSPNASAKAACVVGGMLAGADSIDDMALLRHGAMGTVFDRPYAPSTLGSFLREFSFGHVRQLDAVASRLLVGLASALGLLFMLLTYRVVRIRLATKTSLGDGAGNLGAAPGGGGGDRRGGAALFRRENRRESPQTPCRPRGLNSIETASFRAKSLSEADFSESARQRAE